MTYLAAQDCLRLDADPKRKARTCFLLHNIDIISLFWDSKRGGSTCGCRPHGQEVLAVSEVLPERDDQRFCLTEQSGQDF